jgi:hypothetical protein
MRICPRRHATCTSVRQRPKTRFGCWTDGNPASKAWRDLETFWTRERWTRKYVGGKRLMACQP